MKFLLALALALLAACGPAPLDDSSEDALAAAGSTLASYDPLTSYSAARKAAAALVANPQPIQLHGERTPQPDSRHAEPQPSRPHYKWTWTGSLPPIDVRRLAVAARDIYGALVAAYPAEAHHAFDAYGRTASSLGLGIERRNRGDQVRPWHNAVHLIEKPLTAGGLAILFKRDLCKRRLLHGGASSSVLRYPYHNVQRE